MSRREDRDRRLHSRFERESSPKKPRRDDERKSKSDHEEKGNNPSRDIERQRESRATDSKTEKDSDSIRRDSNLREFKRPRSSYIQHDDRRHGGPSYPRHPIDHGRRRDPSSDRAWGGKAEEGQNGQRKEDSSWKHDRFFELEPSKKRPAFAEPTPANKEPDLNQTERNVRRGGGRFARNNEYHQPRGERFVGRGLRGGRDRFSGAGRNIMNWPGDEKVVKKAEKWKHDMFHEVNQSPISKSEEEQIAKVEALLAS